MSRKKVLIAAIAVVLCCAGLSVSAQSHRLYTSPNDPSKTVQIPLQVDEITIACIACLEDTGPPFVCGSGLGPFATEPNNINSPDTYEYFHASCTPGDTVQVDVYALGAGDGIGMDPIAQACSGDFCGESNAGMDFGTCPTGSIVLDVEDDNLAPVCTPHPFGDPSLVFICPVEGAFTLFVADFLGNDPDPVFEIHADNVTPCVGLPASNPFGMSDLAGVLMLMLLGGVALKLRRV